MGSNSSEHAESVFKVLVGIDFETSGQGALRRAMALAATRPSELHLVAVAEKDAVVNLHPRVPADALERLRKLAEEEIAAFAAMGQPSQIQRVVTHLLHGHPAEEIVWLAAHLDADLIVLGSHRHEGIGRLLLGSVAETVVHAAGCPVLIDRVKGHVGRDDVPRIEPLCQDCARHRAETQGKELWCERHGAPHLRQHVYSWAEHSSEGFRPWGFSV